MTAAPSDGPTRPDAYRAMPKSDAARMASAIDMRELSPLTESVPVAARMTPNAVTASAIPVPTARCSPNATATSAAIPPSVAEIGATIETFPRRSAA